MSVLPLREQYVLISAVGRNPLELTHVICNACQENRCSLTSSRLTRHGQYSVLIVQAGGSWDALARLESSLPNLAERQTQLLLMGLRVSDVRSSLHYQVLIWYLLLQSLLFRGSVILTG